MTTSEGTQRREDRFVRYLEGLVRDEERAALAALRRGLGKTPGEAAEAHRYVLRFNPGLWEEDAYYLVAALFAWHQGSWRHTTDGHRNNLGASFRLLAGATESGSVEKRFVALLNCREDDLPNHLRQAVGLLKAHHIPVDWAQLIRDIRGWDREGRRVQREWARAFWGARDQDETSEDTPAGGDTPAAGNDDDDA